MSTTAIHRITWADATANIDPDLAKHLPSLTKLLEQSDLLLARILTGRSPDSDADDDESRKLEFLLLLHLSNQESESGSPLDHLQVRKAEVIAWLRILYVAIQNLKSHGYGLGTTRLPLPSRPDKSPFSPERVRRIADVERWRHALFKSITTQPISTLPSDDITRIAVSSVLCGCLLNKRKLLQLMNNLHHPIEVARTFAFIDFDLPYRGISGIQHHRWLLDPFTELLILKSDRPEMIATLSEKKLHSDIVDFLKRMGFDRLELPSTLDRFIDFASSYWESRTAMIDIHFVRQRFLSQSLTRESWLRIQQCTETKSPAVQTIFNNRTNYDEFAEDDSNVDDDLVKDSVSSFHWFKEVQGSVMLQRTDSIKQTAISLLEGQLTPPAPTYLGWLVSMLDGRSSSGHSLSESTITKYFLLATPLLISVLGTDDPKTLDPADLTMTYQSLLVEHSGSHPKSLLAKAIREFHFFLARGNKRLQLKDTREVLGDEAVLSPVEARVITFDEYESAKSLLQEKLRKYPKFKVQAALLLLILTFRLGLRRSEAAMLLIADFHLEGNPMLLVRPHAQRRLKSDNSKRSLPIKYFLSVDEMRFVRSYIASRHSVESSQPLSQFVFGNPDEDRALMPIETLVDWIHECIRKVTGDRTLHLHHLRHSFGTWTYLKLRAPDHPILIEAFSFLPKTHMQLRKGRRLRTQLLGTGVHPQRGYAFAVARLLGHSGPHVSLEHYIHACDLVVWADTVRDFTLNVDAQAVLALSPLPQSQTYDLHKSNPIKILAVARTKNPKSYRILPFAGSTTSTVKPKRGRPQTNEKKIWVNLDVVWQVLHMANQSAPVSEISSKCCISDTRVASILSQAKTRQSILGVKPNSPHGLTLPRLPRISGDKNFFNDIELRLSRLFVVNPLLLRKALDIVLEHYARKGGDVVFRNPSVPEDALTFLKLLDAIGFPTAQIRTVIRGEMHGDHKLQEWRNALDRPITNVEYTKGDFGNHPSYGKWIGFKLTDANGIGRPKAFLLAVFLACISIEQ